MTRNNNFNISEKTEERFGMYFSIYRFAGVEILPHRHSKLHMIYALCVFVCTYATIVAMILDVLQHTDDLQYCMDGIQSLGASTNALWIYQFLRYCRSNISKSLSVGWIACFVVKFGDSQLQVCRTALRK
jgi:chromate transport protein ChrA